MTILEVEAPPAWLVAERRRRSDCRRARRRREPVFPTTAPNPSAPQYDLTAQGVHRGDHTTWRAGQRPLSRMQGEAINDPVLRRRSIDSHRVRRRRVPECEISHRAWNRHRARYALHRYVTETDTPASYTRFADRVGVIPGIPRPYEKPSPCRMRRSIVFPGAPVTRLSRSSFLPRLHSVTWMSWTPNR